MTVPSLPESTPPSGEKRTPRDLIARHLEGYGSDQPYRGADRLICSLFDAGFDIVQRPTPAPRTTTEFFQGLPSDESLLAARSASTSEEPTDGA